LARVISWQFVGAYVALAVTLLLLSLLPARKEALQ
jgi:AGZA family xanthine/uracil permease-like MFS transporter